MQKKASSGIMLALLIVGMLTVTFNIKPAEATGTIYIRADGSIDPSTAPISTVDYITYTFTGNINDSIVVERDNIVIDGNGYMLQGQGGGRGITLEFISYATIRNTNINGFNNGIYFGWAAGCAASRNNITSRTGIQVHGDFGSPDIFDNNINNGTNGIVVQHGFANITGNNITNNDHMGIDVYDDSYATISGNNISANGRGISIGSYATGTISRNLVANNSGDGIHCGHGYAYIYENTVTGNEVNGIYVGGDGGGNVIGNMILNNHGAAVKLLWAWDSQLSNNSIAGNGCGVWVESSYDIRIYHNNFIDNTDQVHNDYSVNIWDDGYPSGGNYWSDYDDVDLCNGPSQDLPGMDGIWDHAYVIDADNRDRYPLVKPYPTIAVTVDVAPDTLNLKSKGKWITAYIELPKGYDVSDIDVSTVMLNDTIPVSLLDVPTLEPVPTEIGDYDVDGIPDLMVKFDRAMVESFIYNQGITYSEVALTITGELFDGTPFEGTDVIFVNYAGDANNDGIIDIFDIGVVSAHWYPGPPTGTLGYDSNSDFNKDRAVDIFDIGILSVNWGQTTP